MESAPSIDDFKAAFLCITNSFKAHLKSPEDLTRALQGCGRNPTKRNIDQHWRAYRKIGIYEFCEIANQEEAITETELVNAFRAIDVNEKGYISYKDFMSIFTNEGDQMSPNEVRKLMDEADSNNDKKLDYKEFSKLVIDTVKKTKKIARKRMKKILIDSGEDDVEIRLKKHQHSDKERASPSILSRHSSLSMLSNKSNAEFQFNDDAPYKRKSNSRLSFADEFDEESFKNFKNKREPEGSLKNLLKNEVNIARTKKKDSSFMSDSDVDLRRKHAHDRERDRSVDRKRDVESNRSREGSDSRERRDRRDSSRETLREKDNKPKKLSEPVNLFEHKFQPITRVVETLKEPKNLKKWITKSIKGGFYFNDKLESILSNSYVLDLKSESTIFVSIEIFKTPLHTNSDIMNMDASLLIVKDGKNLTLKGLTENKLKNKWCTKLDLKQGRYFLFPFTSGCHLKKRNFELTKNAPQLFKTDLNNKRTLSRQFKDALSVLFDLCDLDSNGRLSQYELNFYTFLTSNEVLSDEEWRFVGDTVGFEKNELTKEAFINLYKLEALRDDTDVEDIKQRLANMGFNKSLTIDQSCPYNIEISSEVDNFDVLLSEIYRIKSAEEFLLQLVESKGNVKTLKNVDGLAVIEYHTSYLSMIEVKNESRNDYFVEINCSKSENCLTNLRDPMANQKLKSMKSKIFIFVTASNPNKEWILRCSCSHAALK